MFQYATVLLVAFSVLAPLCLGQGRPDPEELKAIEIAKDLYKQGRFPEALNALPAKAKKPDSLVLKARLHLLRNEPGAAKKYAESALKTSPDAREAKELLAESYYRMNRFKEASELYGQLGRKVVSGKLAHLAGSRPYEIVWKDAGPAVAEFITTDPLPVVKARLNGEELNFVIDTGAAELILDTSYSAEKGIRNFGEETGSFAGDQRSAFSHGAIESFAIGGVTIKNVPVNILNTQRFAPILGLDRIHGIIGTNLLSRFKTTLDYPGEKLILEKPVRSGRAEAEPMGTVVPFWLAGDHYPVAWGSINGSPQLFFIDTGLAGLAFTGPASTLKAAGIEYETREGTGVGGGGAIKVAPIPVKELSLGGVKRGNLQGVAGPFPESLEMRLGFRLGGILSHGFFRPYRLTFDFVRMRMYVEEASGG